MSDPQKARNVILEAIMLAGDLHIMNATLESCRQAKSRREKREVSTAEYLAEIVNLQMMSGNVNGIELFKLIDVEHKTNG